VYFVQFGWLSLSTSSPAFALEPPQDWHILRFPVTAHAGAELIMAHWNTRAGSPIFWNSVSFLCRDALAPQ